MQPNTPTHTEYIDGGNANFAFIKGWLDVPFYHLTGTLLKIFTSLGDRTAIVIFRALYLDWNVDEVKLRKILVALSASFEYLTSVPQESDRVPAVTMVLLDALEKRAESEKWKESIQATREAVVAKTRRDPDQASDA